MARMRLFSSDQKPSTVLVCFFPFIKTPLLGELRGTVLEIGPGTGVNLSFYDPSVTWIGIEPNRAMHPSLREKAEALGLSIELRDAPLAEDNSASDSVDAVVSTLVLCSLPDMADTLMQIQRVLKPGGTYAFIEHVADRGARGAGSFRRPRPIRPIISSPTAATRVVTSAERSTPRGFPRWTAHPMRRRCPSFWVSSTVRTSTARR